MDVDIPAESIDMPTLKAISRDSAWDELLEVMKFKVRPVFDTVSQYFLLLQSDDKWRLLKHVYITANLLRGSGKDIAWGDQNKTVVRKALQWMLEQLGGPQFRKYSLTAEKRKPASSTPLPETDGWMLIQEHGELQKKGLETTQMDPASHQLRDISYPWLART